MYFYFDFNLNDNEKVTYCNFYTYCMLEYSNVRSGKYPY